MFLSARDSFPKKATKVSINIMSNVSNLKTPGLTALSRPRAQFEGPEHLFDVGRDAVTEACTKCHRDTFYCPHRVAYCNNNTEIEKVSRLETLCMCVNGCMVVEECNNNTEIEKVRRRSRTKFMCVKDCMVVSKPKTALPTWKLRRREGDRVYMRERLHGS